MLNKGIYISLGTDGGVEYVLIYIVDHTSRFIGTTRIRWNIKEALTLKECVKGSLNVGKFVDFIVLNQEIFELEPID